MMKGFFLTGIALILVLRGFNPGVTSHPFAGEAAYVGSSACKKCHNEQYRAWKKTRMANSFELLKPGERAEQKKKAGLDPQKDYRTDTKCLACHTTGFGKPGGYALPPAGDTPAAKEAQARAKEMEGVGCESCHGPGSLSIPYKKKNESYEWAALVKAVGREGTIFPTKDQCLTCHNTDSPFVGKDYVFDFEKRKEEGTHQHFKLDFQHKCDHTHTPSKKK